MSDFDTSKILAGIGSLIFGGIIGMILVLIGMKGLSEHYKDRRIYDGLVMGAVFLIISSILVVSGLSVMYAGIFTAAITMGLGIGLGIAGIVGGVVCFIIGFILALLAVKHVKNCFTALAERSGEKTFNTASKLIWVGAILTIIGIGFFIMWIGFIIAAIGFFTLKNNQPQQQTYGYTSSPPPTNTGTKSNFCPNCGTSIAPDATFCANCGKQI
ncbi:MAG: DUF996 domain-containing protein [Candidatus Bathyarchaeota archaeon]|nr:DUF996 domain-containing protein [Candidatus Termiticorpusculum sp.]